MGEYHFGCGLGGLGDSDRGTHVEVSKDRGGAESRRGARFAVAIGEEIDHLGKNNFVVVTEDGR